jgi:hypothetical protein
LHDDINRLILNQQKIIKYIEEKENNKNWYFVPVFIFLI